jgi:uncharacterized protein (DUF983 family)
MPYDDELDEGPSDADIERFGGETRTCPECGAETYDESELCPKCGHAFEREAKTLPAWVIIAGVAALAAFVFLFVL